MDVYEKKFDITVADVDRLHNLKLSALFDFFQNITTLHGEDLGVGLDEMLAAGQGWVLSRFSVLVEKRPPFAERLSIKTWPRGSQKLFALRDYEVKDGSGSVCVRGRSGWLVLDVPRRRPLRPQSLIKPLPVNEGLDALAGGAGGLTVRDGLVKKHERTAFYTYIDYNGHVNNQSYIEWIQDAIEPELLEDAVIMRLDINYIAEITCGEIIEIWTGNFEEAESANSLFESGAPASAITRIAIEGRHKANGNAAFRAEIRLK
ncbi:acyl-ACP thioesterase [Spirochaetia bacterium]|nr:acyl-ACP thioesterase [Spirochaetia bacterium]